MNVNENSGKFLKENSEKKMKTFFFGFWFSPYFEHKNHLILGEDLFFWSSTKIRGKIPLSLHFNRFGIVTANFLARQGASGVERL